MKILLETKRLVLRQFTEQDDENLYILNCDPEVMRFTHAPVPTPLNVIREKVLPKYLACYQRWEHWGYWAAHEKAQGEFIGWFHFRPATENKILFRPGVDEESDIELGYRLIRKVWGKGLATEGSRALLNKGFDEWQVQRATASAMAANRASTRVMEKVGMTLVDQYYHEGIEAEMVKYAVDRKRLSGA